MADKITFTPSAGHKIAKAVEQVLGTPTDSKGISSHKRSYYSTGFWAQISGYSGSSPFQYSWDEVNESPYVGFGGGTGQQGIKSGGRSGTTSTNFAYNQYEVYGGQPTQPIQSGTVVWMEYSFDSATPANNFYRFFLFQLPYLSQYQGWYGYDSAIVADYVRAV